MNEPIRKIERAPESYSPKSKPEILTMAQYAAIASDTVADPFNGGEPPRTSNKIQEYRQIQNWENYFLCSAICSVGKKLGSDIDDFHFYSNFTGDNFTYLYAAEKGNPDNVQCDSGVTNYFFVPQFVKKAYAAFGYKCIYLSNAQIKKDFRAVMNAIKVSVDKGVPVLAWGMGNVKTGNGECYNPLPEGCLIGGYDEDDLLYVNLYMGQERLPEGSVDEYGYSAITNGLNATKGLFFAGEQIEKCDMQQVYQSVIDSIPAFLSLLPAKNESGRYSFGKTAFERWAETLEEDLYFSNKTDEELGGICWNLHCSPYCCVCTSSADDFLKKAAEQFPDLTMAAKLVPLYERMKQYRDDIWALQGGFEPPMDKFRTHEFRAQIADILRKMGGLCDEILMAYEEPCATVEEPESYSPKTKPEIINVMEENVRQKSEVQKAIPVQPEIITKKFLLVGFQADIDLKESHWQGMVEVKASLRDNFDKIANKVQPARFIGMWGADPNADYSRSENHSKRLYFYGIEVHSIDNIPSVCMVKDLPESTYAVFKEREHGSPKYEWLSAAGYEPDRKFQQEFVLDMEIFDEIDNDGEQWEVLIPIRMVS